MRCIKCGKELDRRYKTRKYCTECFKIFRAEQKSEWAEYNKEYLKTQTYERTKKLRESIINHYTNGTMKCQCCGENDVNVLTIDHINNDGASQRENKHPYGGHTFYYWIVKNNFPKDFQILCMNCNSAKAWNKDMEYRRNKYE